MIILYLYLLKLKDGKYYVGQSSRPEVRFTDHQIGQGGKWTRLYPPLDQLKIKKIEVTNLAEATLYENWMTLHYMEQYGWQNVRGGDYLDVENERIAEKLFHIYDTETNKIKHYIPDCKYLFGKSDRWLIYILELEHSKYYIGSGKRLGKALGQHFSGSTIAWTRENRPLRVDQLIAVDPEQSYLEIKRKLKDDYTQRYGKDNVLGGNDS